MSDQSPEKNLPEENIQGNINSGESENQQSDSPTYTQNSVTVPPPPSTPTPNSYQHTSHNKKLIIAAVVLVLALIVGAAFVAAAKLGVFGASGDQPSSVVPSNAVAYAAVDFNPSASEQLSAYRFAKKFPSTHVSSKETLKEDLITSALDENSDRKINYDKDIKPWVGDRAAVAVLPTPGVNDGATGVFVVEVTDKSKADDSLKKLQTLLTYQTVASPNSKTPDKIGYAFKNDYVIITEDQKIADKIAAAKETLEDNQTFETDTDTLKSNRIATMWLDVKGLIAAVPNKDKKDVPNTLTDNLNGTVVAGLNVSSDYLELAGHTNSVKALNSTGTTKLAEQLPEDTNIALEVANLGDILTSVWNNYATDDTLGIVEQTKQAGLNLPDDFQTVFGKDFAASVKLDNSAGQVYVTADTDNPDQITPLYTQLTTLLGTDIGLKITPNSSGYTASYGNVETPTSDNNLTDNPDFNKAVAFHDGNTFGYVNLHDLFATFGDTDKNTEHVQSVGFATKTDGDKTDFNIRVTTN